jgi:Undecaprenyl-phosphate galactose phosphotransferase WbaP
VEVSSDAAKVILNVADRAFVERSSTAAPFILIPTNHEQLRAVSTGRWKSAWQRRLAPAVLVLADLSLALLVWEISYLLQGIWGTSPLSVKVAVAAMAPIIIVWVGLRALLGLYPGYGLDSVEQLRRHTYATFATLAILTTFSFSLQVGDLISRLLVGLVILGLLVLTPFVHFLVKSLMEKKGLWGKPVVVLGYKEAGANVVSILKGEWELGYDPVAIFNYRLDAADTLPGGVYDQQALTSVVDVAREYGVDTAIFAMPNIRREQLTRLINLASVSFRRVIVIPNLGGITNSAVVARDFAGTFGVEITQNLLNPWAQRFKRLLDLFGAVVGGLLICPILLTVLMMIKLESPGPAIFIQERPGQNGKPFKIYKFRTMYADAERRFEQLVLENPLLAEEFQRHGKLKDDPRVTRVGRWLRRSSLDELPQLWNVFKGHMSLVGPRPYLINQALRMKDASVVVSRVLPGITGLWQVSGRSEITFEQRIDLDTHYVRNWSVWLDLVILARTVKIVLFSRGAY